MVRTLSFVLALMAIGCKCQEKSLVSTNEPQSVPALTMIMQDPYGGAPEEELQVIRSEGELKKLFSKINKTRKPGLPLPDVDFDRDLLLVYSAGETRGTTFPELELTKSSGGKTIMASKKVVDTREPKEATGLITMPFILYSMPKTDLEVILDVR